MQRNNVARQVEDFCISYIAAFSNEDNCCQLQGIGKLIKEKLSQGIFKVDELVNVAGNTDFVKFIANICKQTNFFTSQVLFGVFPEIMLESFGCGLYMRLYGNYVPYSIVKK